MAEFRVLGPLEVMLDGRPTTLGSRRQRAVLAVLLVNANRATTLDQLLAVLWSDQSPDTAVGQIQTLVWRLRRVLGGAIVTTPGGYRLTVPPGALDTAAFTALAAEGSRLARSGRFQQAVTRFEAALALWRGDPYADVRPPGDASACGLNAARAELAEQRLCAERDLIDVEFALGRHAELVSRLQPRVDAEPLREELRERLMLALYRCGRRAEALEVYRRGRKLLVEQLGLEPGGGLQRLQARMLAGDPNLDGPRLDGPRLDGPSRGSPGLRAPGDPGPPGPDLAVATPVSAPASSQLPMDIADFVARAELVTELSGVLAASRAAGGATPPTVVISGVAGSGKTALAVHVAHQVRASYPDGQLFVDLRGVDGPLQPEDVLARFLRALGEDVRALPAELDERAAMFRSRTTGRRVLVVLDNAGGEAQVRPLLPAEPCCGVLVTSRRRLAAISAARQVDLAVFSTAEALELLGRIATAARVATEPDDCARVVDRCGYLPLAIRIAGARLAARPHLPVARLADQLADERARLDVLRTGDLAVRSSLAASYRTLSEPERRAFELLGALDVPNVAAWVAAPLLDVPAAHAEEHLERLVDARLLEVAGSEPVRYRFHDLVRAYARELAAGRDGVRQALDHAFGAWLALAEIAGERLPGGFRPSARGTAARWSGWRPEELDDLLADPVAWCEAERATLVAVVQQAAASGRDELAWDLACTLGRFFELREHLEDWRIALEAALRACRAAGNRRGEGYVLRALGEMYLNADRLDDALACFAPALSSLTSLGDRQGQALVLRAQGTALRLQHRHEEALDCLARALALCVELDDWVGQAQALHNLGVLHRLAGRLCAAETAYRQALALFSELDDPFGQAYVLCSLGIVVGSTAGGSHVAEAERYLGRSIELCREVGYRRGEAIGLGHLGELHLRNGCPERAADKLRLAVAGCREVGDGPGEAIGLRRLGELYLAQGNLAAARSALRQCLALCPTLDLPAERSRALDLLGMAQTAPRRATM